MLLRRPPGYLLPPRPMLAAPRSGGEGDVGISPLLLFVPDLRLILRLCAAQMQWCAANSILTNRLGCRLMTPHGVAIRRLHHQIKPPKGKTGEQYDHG